ncbi:hypothetical protein D3C83_165870 [compost metagenome]
MNEQEVRAIVRAAVARHLQTDTASAPSIGPLPRWPTASFALYEGLVAVSDDCVIEPAVKCDHCGYCKSQGY